MRFSSVFNVRAIDETLNQSASEINILHEIYFLVLNRFCKHEICSFPEWKSFRVKFADFFRRIFEWMCECKSRSFGFEIWESAFFASGGS